MKTKSFLATVVLIGTALAQEDTALGEQSRLLPDEILELDVNDDGAIDVEEHQAIRDYRQQLDREQRNSNDLDDDGETTDEEIEAAREAVRKIIVKRRKKRFNEVAGDDGLLSIDEFAGIPEIARLPDNIIEGIFYRLDADQSGVVTQKEFLDRLPKLRKEEKGDSEPDSE